MTITYQTDLKNPPKREKTRSNFDPIVQPIETIGGSARFPSYRRFFAAKMPGAMLAAERFYEKIDSFYGLELTARFSQCRQWSWYVRHKLTGHVRIASKQCRLRDCPMCGIARMEFVAHQILPWMIKAKNPKLLTLTIKHTDDPLIEQIEYLKKSFKKLRQRKFWKDHVAGGFWFFQVTFNQKNKQWHVHLHIILDSTYMLNIELQRLWRQITGSSFILKINVIEDYAQCVKHHARYVARPLKLTDLPEDRWPEYYEAFNGIRLVTSFGSARSVSLRPTRPDDADMWENVGDYTKVNMLKDDDDNARAIFDAHLFEIPLKPDINMNHIKSVFEDEPDKERAPPDWVTEPYFDYVQKT